MSKVEVVILGVLGTFLVNVFRMAFITALAYDINEVATMIIHDYLAAFLTLIWMIFFGWFSYAFVLEAKAVTRVASDRE